MPKDRGIATHRAERFCEEYVVDFHAREAAVRAGYSPRSAHTAACNLLKKPEIQARIDQLRVKLSARADRTAAEVVRDLVAWTQEAHDMGDFKTAMKGLELQLKRLGELADRHEICGIDGAPVQQELVIRLVKPGELTTSDSDDDC